MQTSSADKALQNGRHAIQAMAERSNLTKRVIKRAILIFKDCYENKCLRGYSQDATVAACIYTACRNEDSARTMKG